MKATGIVRRIDDLGRVVIPKEIRRTLRIREGDPLEIFTGREGEVILKKYSPIGELATFAKQYAESLSQTLGETVCITDNDQIIAAAGTGRKDLQDKMIRKEFENALQRRECILAGKEESFYLNIADGAEEYGAEELIYPIICQGDVIGSVVLLKKESRKKIGEAEQKVLLSAAIFLGKQMEQ